MGIIKLKDRRKSAGSRLDVVVLPGHLIRMSDSRLVKFRALEKLARFFENFPRGKKCLGGRTQGSRNERIAEPWRTEVRPPRPLHLRSQMPWGKGISSKGVREAPCHCQRASGRTSSVTSIHSGKSTRRSSLARATEVAVSATTSTRAQDGRCSGRTPPSTRSLRSWSRSPPSCACAPS